MMDRNSRLDALNAAVAIADKGESAEQVIVRADAFYEWLTNVRVMPTAPLLPSRRMVSAAQIKEMYTLNDREFDRLQRAGLPPPVPQQGAQPLWFKEMIDNWISENSHYSTTARGN